MYISCIFPQQLLLIECVSRLASALLVVRGRFGKTERHVHVRSIVRNVSVASHSCSYCLNGLVRSRYVTAVSLHPGPFTRPVDAWAPGGSRYLARHTLADAGLCAAYVSPYPVGFRCSFPGERWGGAQPGSLEGIPTGYQPKGR